MFDRIRDWARRRAQAAAARRRLRIAAELAAELPRDVAVVIEGENVRLLARRLSERAALDPELRSLLGRVR
ncbi:MAG TPA: hypothetical protein VD887_08045 [Allosphingosinicella sp.]|nr:hypothetical protein [Allosphingosinicella sp.]